MPHKKKSIKTRRIFAIVDNSVGDFKDHPYFIKKAEEAKAYLRKVGVPKGFPKID